jgi:hypothetical protein
MAFHRDRSVTFEPEHDGEWHPHTVRLPVDQPLTGLRIDPSTGPGEIRLDGIRLKDKEGRVIRAWPVTAPPMDQR